MNGFKDGAAGGAFGGDDDADEDDDPEQNDEPSVATDSSPDRAGDRRTGGSDAPTASAENTSAAGGAGLPWLYRRSSITDGREKTVQLHLQSSTLDEQRDAIAEVESRLGESVNKADLREAAFLVGLRHLDEVAATLREWGYDVD